MAPIGDAPGPDPTAVLKWVRACELKPLVIVDSLVAFLKGDENDAGEMRRFKHYSRRLADLGATVVVVHHDGKAESARDIRGSSDFKAAVDAAFHVTNIGGDRRIDKIRLPCFKSRCGPSGDITYHYADGRFLQDDTPLAPARTNADVLRSLRRTNPRIKDGVLEGCVTRETGPFNKHRLIWNGGEK